MIISVNKIDIKVLMVKKNWNIKDLANNVPMNYLYLLEILNGKRIPSVTMAIKISNALEVDVREIFSFELSEKEPY